jgi:hypothetical protein
MVATLLRADGTEEEVLPENGGQFSTNELRFFVGGLPEVVYLGNDTVIVVNDEGHLIGLPLNRRASSLYRHTPIVGDVLFCSRSMIR